MVRGDVLQGILIRCIRHFTKVLCSAILLESAIPKCQVCDRNEMMSNLKSGEIMKGCYQLVSSDLNRCCDGLALFSGDVAIFPVTQRASKNP